MKPGTLRILKPSKRGPARTDQFIVMIDDPEDRPMPYQTAPAPAGPTVPGIAAATAPTPGVPRPRAGNASAGLSEVLPGPDGRPLDHVEAPLTYHVPDGRKPVIVVAAPEDGRPRRETSYATRTVRIHDARPLAGTLSLDRHGFALRRHVSRVRDFHDDAEVEAVYYPETAALVRAMTGAAAVHVFDHTVRVDTGADANGGRRQPVRTVHNDYTERSGPQRVRDLLGEEEAGIRLGRRFAEVNVWRPIVGPVGRTPLALLDARTLDEARDLVAADLVYGDRTGEIYDVAFHPGHRWFYFPAMTRDEVVLIKGYDAARDGRARFAPHTAFDHPDTTATTPARESIEMRAFAFFDDA